MSAPMKLGPATMEALHLLVDGGWHRTTMRRQRPPGTVHGIAARVLVLRGLACDVQKDGVWGVVATPAGVEARSTATVGRDLDWHRRNAADFRQPRRFQLLLELLTTQPGLTAADLKREGLSPRVSLQGGAIVAVWGRTDVRTNRGRTVRRYYLAGDEPPSASTVDRCTAAIAAAPGLTIHEIHATMAAEVPWSEVVIAMQTVSRRKLARRVGWRPSRWYPNDGPVPGEPPRRRPPPGPRRVHAPGCVYLVAVCRGTECEHGRACPTCNPCSCGVV
jgi:hypothetical protein